jgi:hypothetical protein
MKKIVTVISILSFVLPGLYAQQKPAAPSGYQVKVTVKNSKDSALYLAIYTFDKTPIVDTAYRKKDGSFIFKKKGNFPKGIYILANQNKERMTDFIINESTQFSFSYDPADLFKTIAFENSPENIKLYELLQFMSDYSKEGNDYRASVLEKKLPDSTKLIYEKNMELDARFLKFKKEFLAKNPSGFMSDVVRMQMEPDISNPPLANNGRPDSLWKYVYFKDNVWKDIPLEDERILHTPVIAEKMKNYFSKTLLQIPDSVIKEIPKVIDRLKKSPESYKWILSWMTMWSEQTAQKYMEFESVFVYIVEKYYETGQVDFYTKEQLKKIIARKNVLKPLLIGKRIPELFTVDTNGMKVCRKLKLDTCKTSDCLTSIYEKNRPELNQQLISLHNLKADYTVLVFWDIDCGHCKKDMPVLFEKFKELRSKDGIDIKVMAVYDQENFVKWPSTLREMKLLDENWQNVADGVHLQNFKEKFDVYSNPVIYILDSEKVIRYKRIGAEQLDLAIHNLVEMKKRKN